MQSKIHTKRETQGATGLYELFLITMPIEDVAHWHYKTVQIYSLLTSRQFRCQMEGADEAVNTPKSCHLTTGSMTITN